MSLIWFVATNLAMPIILDWLSLVAIQTTNSTKIFGLPNLAIAKKLARLAMVEKKQTLRFLAYFHLSIADVLGMDAASVA
jgi:hypothetical protein